MIEEELDPLRRKECVRNGDSIDRAESGEAVAEGECGECSEEMIRCPADLIVGCTRLPALRFLYSSVFPSRGAAGLCSSWLWLDALDKSLLEE